MANNSRQDVRYMRKRFLRSAFVVLLLGGVCVASAIEPSAAELLTTLHKDMMSARARPPGEKPAPPDLDLNCLLACTVMTFVSCSLRRAIANLESRMHVQKVVLGSMCGGRRRADHMNKMATLPLRAVVLGCWLSISLMTPYWTRGGKGSASNVI